jgi:hypothetical protein
LYATVFSSKAAHKCDMLGMNAIVMVCLTNLDQLLMKQKVFIYGV